MTYRLNKLLWLGYLLGFLKILDGTGLQIPPIFDLKIVYSYVVEVADSESDLGLHSKALVSEILAFYHLKYARGRPGRRGHVHLGQIFLLLLCFSEL